MEPKAAFSAKHCERQSQLMNLNLTEVEKFDSLATQWWDKQGEFRTLHDINPLRANWIDNKSPVAGKRLLDVGCGGGILCESLAQRGADVIGIDAGKQSIKVANLHKLIFTNTSLLIKS